MDRSPKILIVTDEPMLMVDMLSELEDRGFSVEPMKPGEQRKWLQPNSIEAAVFDLHQADEASLQFASQLRRSQIPLVSLEGGAPFNSVRIAGAQTCISRPVDYDRLADLLYELVNRHHPITPHSSADALRQLDAMGSD